MTSKVWIAPMIWVVAMVFWLAYQQDEMKITQDALVLLAADGAQELLKHDLDLSMTLMPEGGHKDGISVHWDDMSLAEFVDEYPDSHFIHMEFEDAVLTIDWSHANWAITNEKLRNILGTIESEKEPDMESNLLKFNLPESEWEVTVVRHPDGTYRAWISEDGISWGYGAILEPKK